MPKNATVFVLYGPYESCGLVAYRTFRLEGLESRGHRCVLEESRDWNTVEIVVHGECVFTCGVKDLQFGGDGRLDPVCQKAVIAVENAY